MTQLSDSYDPQTPSEADDRSMIQSGSFNYPATTMLGQRGLLGPGLPTAAHTVAIGNLAEQTIQNFIDATNFASAALMVEVFAHLATYGLTEVDLDASRRAVLDGPFRSVSLAHAQFAYAAIRCKGNQIGSGSNG